MRCKNVVKALCYRAFRGLFAEKGRIIEMLLYPVASLMIWGLFLYADIVATDVARDLFLINMVWGVMTMIQVQANNVMMHDLWSREFPELFRSGIDTTSYLIAMLTFGIVMGIIGTVLFSFLSLLFFGLSVQDLLPLFISFPCFLIFALGLAVFAAAIIIRLNQTYGFIAFNLLTFIVMLSSPYVPVEKLPVVLQKIASASPLGMIFEYIRHGDLNLLYTSTLLSCLLLVVSFCFYRYSFKRLRQKGNIFSL